MQGWVTREEAREGSIYKPWVKQFLVLSHDVTNNIFSLKYAATQAVVDFPSQLKGTLKLSRDMKAAYSGDGSMTKDIVNGGDNGNSQSVGSSERKNWMVQVIDSRGNSKMSFVVDTQADQLSWYEHLNSAINECA
jgi:hypothetical protein